MRTCAYCNAELDPSNKGDACEGCAVDLIRSFAAWADDVDAADCWIVAINGRAAVAVGIGGGASAFLPKADTDKERRKAETGRQKCQFCNRRSLPGMTKGGGHCASHWAESRWGREWAMGCYPDAYPGVDADWREVLSTCGFYPSIFAWETLERAMDSPCIHCGAPEAGHDEGCAYA